MAYSSFRKYRDNNVALSAALKKGKEVIDCEVENALAFLSIKVCGIMSLKKNEQPRTEKLFSYRQNKGINKYKELQGAGVCIYT